MSEDNHGSVMTIMSESSSDIRTSSCGNLFLGHCALKWYIFSGSLLSIFKNSAVYIYTGVFFLE